MSRLQRPLPIILGLGLVLGLFGGACFTPPNDPVLFSCDFDGQDSCPPDYECRDDDCCHGVGTPADDQVGACALGGNTGMTSTGTTETTMGEESGTDESGTDSTGESGSDTTG